MAPSQSPELGAGQCSQASMLFEATLPTFLMFQKQHNKRQPRHKSSDCGRVTNVHHSNSFEDNLRSCNHTCTMNKARLSWKRDDRKKREKLPILSTSLQRCCVDDPNGVLLVMVDDVMF